MYSAQIRRLFMSLCFVLFAFTQASCDAKGKARVPRAARDSTGRVPAGYYDSVNGLSGRDLKVALGRITADHEVFAYGSLWYYYELTDVVIGTDNQVFDYYSPWQYYFTGLGTAPNGANKEHACPQSWWGSGAICNAYVDLFNVMPSEVQANSAKSNYPLGVVGSPTYRNSHMRVGPSARPEYEGPVFEPCDEYKGDFARIYFYVATTYADAAWGCKESVAHTVAFRQEDYPTIQPWLLSLLLEWNAQDPVSDWEVTRNERVFSQQHNRNPFIDYPQLADHIWGSLATEPFVFSSSETNGADADTTGGFFTDEGGSVPGGSDQPVEDEVDLDEVFAHVLLSDDFSAVVNGNDFETSGSSTSWAGDETFPTVTSAFEAGGAIRLGSSKKSGSIQSVSLGNAAGATLLVVLQVKGWTTIEGQLQARLLSPSGNTVATQVVPYTHTITDGFEQVCLTFADCPAGCSLELSTTERRVFLSAVYVGTPASGQQALHSVPAAPASSSLCYNLLGQPVSVASACGLRLCDNKLIFYSSKY